MLIRLCLDTVQVKFESQGHRSKFKVRASEEENKSSATEMLTVTEKQA